MNKKENWCVGYHCRYKQWDMEWTYPQNERQQVDHEVHKLDMLYTQSNVWPSEDEMA